MAGRVYASEQGRRGIVLSVVTGVAASYIGLRGLDRQLEIAQATAANYAETAKIFDLRFKGGVVSQVEVAQVESQYQQALAAIPVLEQQIAAQENLISVLLGRNPGPVPRGKRIDALVAPAIPGDLPSALLERRPDILQAEFNLVAANADIGAAKALYFPTLSLTGVLGSVSTALGDFLSGPATAWSLAAGLAGPVFTFGAIEGQVQFAEGAQREAVAFYQQTLLGAFRETNDALVGSVKRRQESEAQARRVTALRDYARLSRLRFDNGYASFLEVLYAENELFSAELNAVRSTAERYTQISARNSTPCARRPSATRRSSTCSRRSAAAGSTRPSGSRRRRSSPRRLRRHHPSFVEDRSHRARRPEPARRSARAQARGLLGGRQLGPVAGLRHQAQETERGIGCRPELVPGERVDRHQVVLGHRLLALAEANGAVATQDQHGVRVFVPFERRMAAGGDLEVAQFARLVRRREQHLARDVAERRAAILLVAQSLDPLPAEVAGRVRREMPHAAHAATSSAAATASTKARLRSASRSRAISSEPPINSMLSGP